MHRPKSVNGRHAFRFPLLLVGGISLSLVGCGGSGGETGGEMDASHEAQPVRLGPVDGMDLSPVDLERVAVGSPAPDFSLQTIGGDTLTLSAFRGVKNVVLVFYRGHWWPYCARQLVELKALLTEDQENDTQLIALSVDSPEDLRRMVDKVSEDGQSPRFPFLTDPGHEVIDRYGLFNENDPRGRQLTHPATYVIDKDGVVRWKHVEVDYKVRPSNEDILKALGEID